MLRKSAIYFSESLFFIYLSELGEMGWMDLAQGWIWCSPGIFCSTGCSVSTGCCTCSFLPFGPPGDNRIFENRPWAVVYFCEIWQICVLKSQLSLCGLWGDAQYVQRHFLCFAEVVLYSQKCDLCGLVWFYIKIWGWEERKGRKGGLGCFLTAFR